jgi:hypothetical protein
MVDETMEAWVLDVEKTLADSLAEAEGAKWTAQSIYLVPVRMKSPGAGAGTYKPRTVSLGPYHHGDPELLPMEVHKSRALRHVVRRSGKTVRELAGAAEEVAEQLESAYADLGGEWRGPANRSRFLQVMVTDGCFVLEVMRIAAGKHVQDYAPKSQRSRLQPAWHAVHSSAHQAGHGHHGEPAAASPTPKDHCLRECQLFGKFRIVISAHFTNS